MGGVNICNFDLKARALRLAGMVSVLDSPDDSSFFLCTYFVGWQLAFCTLVGFFCVIIPLLVLVLPLRFMFRVS